MTRGVAGLVVVAMLAGCGTYATSKSAAQGGGKLILGTPLIGLVGLLAIASHPGGDPASVNRTVTAGAIGLGALLAIGVGLAVGGLIGMGLYDEYPEEPSKTRRVPESNESEQQAAARRHRVAKSMFVKAQDAARNGDCAIVIKLESEVRALDSKDHGAWLRDVAIKTCLDDASAAQTAQPVTPPPDSAVPPSGRP